MHKYRVMNDLQEDLINVETAGTLDGLFYERLRRSPDLTAYRDFNAVGRDWRDTTWSEVADQVARWRTAIAGEGFERTAEHRVAGPVSTRVAVTAQGVVGQGHAAFGDRATVGRPKAAAPWEVRNSSVCPGPRRE